MKRTFNDVIAQHRKEKKKGTEQEVKEALFSLINNHQDLDKLTDEALLSIKVHENVYADCTVAGLFSALKDESGITAVPLSSLAATKCAARLNSVVETEEGLILNPDQVSTIQLIIEVIKRVQRDTGFNRAFFIKAINKNRALPLELVWRLHKSGIMTIDSYIKSNIDSPGIIGNFPQDLVSVCLCDLDDVSLSLRKEIVEDVLSFLVLHAFSDDQSDGVQISKGMKKVATAILDSVAKKVLGIDEQLPVKTLQPAFCIYEVLMKPNGKIPKGTLKKFSSRMIVTILKYSPLHSVSEALQRQEHWTYAKSPSWMTDLYTNLLVALEPEEALAYLSRTLEQQEVNWKSSLACLSTFLVLYEEAPSLIQEKVKSLLSVGLEACEMDSLILAFLLVRQASLEGPHVFPPYHDWFARTFGDISQSPASNRKSFSFLMKFLTDIVPFDGVTYLKAHIHHPPALPPTCRPLLSDYILLARTRLQDIQVPLEDSSLLNAGQISADKEKIDNQAERDVEAAIISFEKTGRLPNSVMEASIFRKPYFIGHFLPVLLKPRPLPDDPDPRMKLISLLYSKDKIPSSLYNNYEKACQKISTELLEGIQSDDDADMEELLLSPSEQLDRALNNFAEAVIKMHTKKGKTGVSGYVSIVSEKIAAQLGTDGPSTINRDICIDLNHPAYSKVTMKIADRVLDCIGRILLGLSSVATHQRSWLHQLLLSLSCHNEVWKALLYKIWVLTLQHGCDLSPCHINCLAAIILHLTSGVVPSQTIIVKEEEGKSGGFVERILDLLPHYNEAWMKFSLRFCTCCIQHALKAFPEFSLHYTEKHPAVLPRVLLHKFIYLLNRLCPESRLCREVPENIELKDEEMTLPVFLYMSDLITDVLQSAPISLSYWAQLEIQVFSHDDVLSCWERQEYFEWIIDSYTGDPGPPDAYINMCSDIAKVIIDFDIRLQNIPSVCGCQNLGPNGIKKSRAQRCNSREHLVSLLQSLQALIKYEGDIDREGELDRSLSWLSKLWEERQQKHEKNEYSIAFHLEHMAVNRLSQSLRPGLSLIPPLAKSSTLSSDSM